MNQTSHGQERPWLLVYFRAPKTASGNTFRISLYCEKGRRRMAIYCKPTINIRQLKEEIKRVTELNRYHKKRAKESMRILGDFTLGEDIRYNRKSRKWIHRDPIKHQAFQDWCESSRELSKLSYQVTKLCTLRALTRGKDHFGPNSQFLSQRDQDFLWKWVYPEAQKFALSGI